MKERPILFSAPMVRAILEGRKTQTRRVIKVYTHKDLPGQLFYKLPSKHFFALEDDKPPEWYQPMVKSCPYGQPGDSLWVRETWRLEDFAINGGDFNASVGFRADNSIGTRKFGLTADEKVGWRPSIFMPRWASRITLKVTAVRVERVQNISEQDAIAEGVTPYRLAWWDGFIRLNDQRMHVQRFVSDLDNPGTPPDDMEHAELQRYERPARDEFRALWGSINAKRGYGWDVNPWCWCITFEVQS